MTQPEYIRRVEKFRSILRVEIEQTNLNFQISHVDLARVLQEETTRVMLLCLADPREALLVKTLADEAARKIAEAVAKTSE